MIRLIKPYIGFAELEPGIKEILDSGILTKGKYSKLFPEAFKAYTGAQHAFLATSATTALTMALKIVGVRAEDEVIVSDFSFPASANVVEDLGAHPVFADVSLETFTMLPAQLIEKLTPLTRAVIFVDALGNPSFLDEISSICTNRGIPLIEDAACGIGSRIGEQRVGAIADITCFSLHPRKLLTCGEGGVITTNNDTYAESLKTKLNHGQDETGAFVTFGYNYRLPEIASLMGYEQLKLIDSIIVERRGQALRYVRELSERGFVLQQAHDNVYHNFQSVVFTVPNMVSRDGLIAYLKEREIESTIGTYCLSGCSYYRQKYDDIQPNASFLQNHTLTVPCYHDVPVEQVCDAIISYCDSAQRTV